MDFKGQVGQDKWVAEYFQYKRQGFFLDLGAYDGVNFSNTYFLEKRLDWRGICVEPGKELYRKLIKHRRANCINKAISNVDGKVNFNEAGYGGAICETGLYEIETITLDSLLAEYNCPKKIDYISLDIEGHEAKALSMFPFDKYFVYLWTIEHNAYMDGGINKENIQAIMFANGYSIAKENVECEGNIFEDWFINTKLL